MKTFRNLFLKLKERMSNNKSFYTRLYSSYAAYYWNQFCEDLNIPDKGFTNTNRRKSMFFILIQANKMNIVLLSKKLYYNTNMVKKYISFPFSFIFFLKVVILYEAYMIVYSTVITIIYSDIIIIFNFNVIILNIIVIYLNAHNLMNFIYMYV